MQMTRDEQRTAVRDFLTKAPTGAGTRKFLESTGIDTSPWEFIDDLLDIRYTGYILQFLDILDSSESIQKSGWTNLRTDKSMILGFYWNLGFRVTVSHAFQMEREDNTFKYIQMVHPEGVMIDMLFNNYNVIDIGNIFAWVDSPITSDNLMYTPISNASLHRPGGSEQSSLYKISGILAHRYIETVLLLPGLIPEDRWPYVPDTLRGTLEGVTSKVQLYNESRIRRNLKPLNKR